jgi:hypothetical protein
MIRALALAAGLAGAAFASTAAAQDAAPQAAPPVADTPAPDGAVGACTWARLPETDREAVLAAYRQDIMKGMDALKSRNATVKAGFLACAGRSDVPPLWTESAVASRVIQDGAARSLLETNGLDRVRLEDAWTRAPEATKACVKAHASLLFLGKAAKDCTDRRAIMWLIEDLGLKESKEPRVQAVFYYNAKMQSAWAEGLIARFRREEPRKPQ